MVAREPGFGILRMGRGWSRAYRQLVLQVGTLMDTRGDPAVEQDLSELQRRLGRLVAQHRPDITNPDFK